MLGRLKVKMCWVWTWDEGQGRHPRKSVLRTTVYKEVPRRTSVRISKSTLRDVIYIALYVPAPGTSPLCISQAILSPTQLTTYLYILDLFIRHLGCTDQCKFLGNLAAPILLEYRLKQPQQTPFSFLSSWFFSTWMPIEFVSCTIFHIC